jgi:hypothetical protein
MTILRLTRFSLDAGRTDEMLATRAMLIDAVRAKVPGLTETRLARVDDETWLDLWRWESAEALAAALAVAPTMPEAAAAFGMIRDATEERLDLVDER